MVLGLLSVAAVVAVVAVAALLLLVEKQTIARRWLLRAAHRSTLLAVTSLGKQPERPKD